jgi:hypothetical protein
VAGFTASQKNRKLARSTSSKKASSSELNLYFVGSPSKRAFVSGGGGETIAWGGCGACAGCGFWPIAFARFSNGKERPSEQPAAAREDCRSHSRREVFLAITGKSFQKRGPAFLANARVLSPLDASPILLERYGVWEIEFSGKTV